MATSDYGGLSRGSDMQKQPHKATKLLSANSRENLTLLRKTIDSEY